VPDVYEEFDCLTLRTQSTNNKQGSADILYCVNPETAENLARAGHEQQQNCFEVYNQMIEAGVAREQARNVLPLATYTEMYWKIDLHNLFHFLTLRLHPHAQLEIREFADAIFEIVKDWVPVAAEAFVDYRLEGVSLSRQELELIKSALDTLALTAQSPTLSKREHTELLSKLGIQL
jgi:thymidylate synthase (FAD)